MNLSLRFLFVCLAAGRLLAASLPTATVQVDLQPLLNARIVTTLTAGRLVAWRDSLDGSTSGEATLAAATHLGEPFSRALPDDGVIAATGAHPRVELHFSNAVGDGNQVRRSLAADEYTITVPPQAYRQFWLAMMSGMGESTLRLQLAYADGRVETRDLVVPDWYFPVPAGESRRVNLAEDLGKWNQQNHLMEKDHHFLHGFDLAPDSQRVLTAVTVTKAPKAVLTLWGAVGVTR